MERLAQVGEGLCFILNFGDTALCHGHREPVRLCFIGSHTVEVGNFTKYCRYRH